MICPVCKSDMIDVEHNRIELDYCINCQGVWFDSEELELLMETMGLEESSLTLSNVIGFPEAETSEQKRRCPICGQRMGKATIGREPKVLVDVCRQGDGLWFDGGEVSQLIKQLIKKPQKKKDSQQQVITFLGEVFQAQD
jgi:Zn-finger nucleic acid-binding protein